MNMIPIEKFQAVKTIITHENCADGVVSAIFLHEVLPEAEIKFVQYGTEAQRTLEATQGMLFCDFSPHPDHFQKFVDAGTLILDHHKTAKGIVEAFGENGVFGDEIENPGVCGAVLAYREVWIRMIDQNQFAPGQLVFAKSIAELIGIRDTWLNKHPQWEDACELSEILRPSTSIFPAEYWLGHKHPFDVISWWHSAMEAGHWLIQKRNHIIQRALKSAYRFTTSRGTRVLMFEGVTLSSDAAEAAGDDADIIIGFDYVGIENNVATLVFSTRSHTTYDCASLCKSQGGGGHTKAAGFPYKFDLKNGSQDPYSIFSTIIERYEDIAAVS